MICAPFGHVNLADANLVSMTVHDYENNIFNNISMLFLCHKYILSGWNFVSKTSLLYFTHRTGVIPGMGGEGAGNPVWFIRSSSNNNTNICQVWKQTLAHLPPAIRIEFKKSLVVKYRHILLKISIPRSATACFWNNRNLHRCQTEPCMGAVRGGYVTLTGIVFVWTHSQSDSLWKWKHSTLLL